MALSIGTALPPPFTPTPTRKLDYAYVEWVDPTETAWPLTNPGLGYFLTDGVAGLGSVPVTNTYDLRSRGGSKRRSSRAESRIITIPLFVTASTHMDFRALWLGLEDAFTRTIEEGPGILRIVRPDGSERRILGYYDSGFDGDVGDSWRWDVAPIQIYCEDGYWSDPNAVTLGGAFGPSGRNFLGPYPTTAGSAFGGDQTLTNPGQVIAYGDWTINGPFSQFVATNNRTGQVFTINPGSPLIAGESRVITTNPPTIKTGAGVDALSELLIPGSTLWGLQRGDTEVTFTAAGAGTGTAIAFTFNPRYKLA